VSSTCLVKFFLSPARLSAAMPTRWRLRHIPEGYFRTRRALTRASVEGWEGLSARFLSAGIALIKKLNRNAGRAHRLQPQRCRGSRQSNAATPRHGIGMHDLERWRKTGISGGIEIAKPETDWKPVFTTDYIKDSISRMWIAKLTTFVGWAIRGVYGPLFDGTMGARLRAVPHAVTIIPQSALSAMDPWANCLAAVHKTLDTAGN